MNNTIVDIFIEKNRINVKDYDDIAKIFFVTMNLGSDIYSVNENKLASLINVTNYKFKKYFHLVLNYLEELYEDKLDYGNTSTEEIISIWTTKTN